MSVSVSEQLAERYSLQLSDPWRQWFDEDSRGNLLAGQYHVPVDVTDLLESAPHDVWPGFMLPDTLPLVGNNYGDWWCLRVGPDDTIVEVIQWSHGGGDYLPVGKTIAEAVLWDRLQSCRATVIDSQPASHEFPTRGQWPPSERLLTNDLESWLARRLMVSTEELRRLVALAQRGQYVEVLKELLDRDWSACAAACELIEIALQGSLSFLADTSLARRCGINWAPEYTSWLFDTGRILPEARLMLLEQCPQINFDQDWDLAGRCGQRIAALRTDLSWAGDIAGWACERSGQLAQAIEHYFDNRHASAFADQSVRLRSHWFSDHLGKFSIAQLSRLRDSLSDVQRDDPYLQLLWREPAHRTRSAIREYWMGLAQNAVNESRFADAYSCYVQAGWDLGAERLSDYIEILEGMSSCATLAGWAARARIAATHAECLRRRLPPTMNNLTGMR